MQCVGQYLMSLLKALPPLLRPAPYKNCIMLIYVTTIFKQAKISRIMSGTLSMALLILFLLINIHPVLPLFTSSMSWPLAATTRPLDSNPQNYVTLKPERVHGEFRKPEVNSCLPKGFRRSSAPSRYVNYHTLGSSSTGCSPGERMSKPWSVISY